MTTIGATKGIFCSSVMRVRVRRPYPARRCPDPPPGPGRVQKEDPVHRGDLEQVSCVTLRQWKNLSRCVRNTVSPDFDDSSMKTWAWSAAAWRRAFARYRRLWWLFHDFAIPSYLQHNTLQPNLQTAKRASYSWLVHVENRQEIVLTLAKTWPPSQDPVNWTPLPRASVF